MPTGFPTIIDEFINPTGSEILGSATNCLHSVHHANHNDAITALELKVGLDGSVDVTSHDYKLSLVTSGTYTPTLTNVANLSASTAFQCQYLRVGSVVTVSGKVSIDPTLAATPTALGISLPVASNLGAVEDCGGVAFASGIAGQGAAIVGDITNNRAEMQWISTDITNQPMSFTFTYEVI